MLSPGTTFGRYELLHVVGRGGMGEVWAARLTGAHGFERLVALKTIVNDDADSATKMREMFIDEARTAALIRQDNVVPVLDFGEEHGRLYLVMEWIEGEPLTSFANLAQNGHTVPLPLVLKLAGDMCRGLHAAHTMIGKDTKLLGIVHRDISPANVMVTDSGVAKVLDFGIARSRDRIAKSVIGEMRGRIRYFAPEQVRGGEATLAVDIWATGLIMHLLLTGVHPLAGMNEGEIGAALLSDRPLELKLESNEPVTAIVRRALEKTPAARYRSAEEMKYEIDRLARSQGIVATGDDVAAFMQWRFAASLRSRAQRAERAIAMPSRMSPAPSMPPDSPRVVPNLVPNLVSNAAQHTQPTMAVPDLVLTHSSVPPRDSINAVRPSSPHLSKSPAASAARLQLAPPVAPPTPQTIAAKPAGDNAGRMLAALIALILALLVVVAAFARLRHWRSQPNPEVDVPAIPDSPK